MKSKTAVRFSAREIALVSLFAAFTAVMAQIVIPMSPVPFTFGLFGVMLCAAVLPLKLSFASQLVYLLLGAFGAPVFSSFSGGFQKLAGPTGGYLVGYLALVLVVGFFKKRKPDMGVLELTLVLSLGFLCCYAVATAWLAVGLGYTLKQAFLVGVVPFVAFDFIKAAGAAAIGLRLRSALRYAGFGG